MAALATLQATTAVVFPIATLPTVTVDAADDAVHDEVQIAEVTRHGDAVTGKIVNRGDAEIRDIRLLIAMPFLWANEVKPGDESPGRSSVLTVAGPLAPRGTLAFEFTPNPPLPSRSDGRFGDPQAHVLGYQTITLR